MTTAGNSGDTQRTAILSSQLQLVPVVSLRTADEMSVDLSVLPTGHPPTSIPLVIPQTGDLIQPWLSTTLLDLETVMNDDGDECDETSPNDPISNQQSTQDDTVVPQGNSDGSRTIDETDDAFFDEDV